MERCLAITWKEDLCLGSLKAYLSDKLVDESVDEMALAKVDLLKDEMAQVMGHMLL